MLSVKINNAKPIVLGLQTVTVKGVSVNADYPNKAIVSVLFKSGRTKAEFLPFDLVGKQTVSFFEDAIDNICIQNIEKLTDVQIATINEMESTKDMLSLVNYIDGVVAGMNVSVVAIPTVTEGNEYINLDFNPNSKTAKAFLAML